jgi:uncharacterized protein (TIGR04255 family)
MTNEVFSNPSVIEVDYEVRFTPLFYINQKIGDFQLEILDAFPKSSQQVQSSVTFDENGIALKDETNKSVLSWTFKTTDSKTKIIVRQNSLIISSTEFKSYDSYPANKFRDIISQTISKFRKHVPIKNFNRIGLRYIDKCPLDELTNEHFCKFYKPIIDINRYHIEDLIDNLSQIRIRKPPHYLLLQTGIKEINGKYQYFMDFDGYAQNIDPNNVMEVSDALRAIVHDEFYLNITEDFKDYMRRDIL